MEHVIAAEFDGVVRRVTMSVGDVRQGYPVIFVEATEVTGGQLPQRRRLIWIIFVSARKH